MESNFTSTGFNRMLKKSASWETLNGEQCAYFTLEKSAAILASFPS